ncbi:hypothetical protein ACFWZT_17245 [Streptomyces alboflavus]|uniref:hypothetical protein n=1 Tax=Streptomyces alboflavus TaxID=67267 RepID=UPI0036BD7AE0
MRRQAITACVAALVTALAWSTPTSGAPASRANDPQPHRGGADLVVHRSQGDFGCTSGFTVRRWDDGKRAMATAGHCSNALTGVKVTSGQYTYGSFSRAAFEEKADLGLITGTPDSPQTYAPTLWTDGGPAGSPVARRVLGKVDAPAEGSTVCISGNVTKLVCDITVRHLSDGVECEKDPPRRCTRGLARGVKGGQTISDFGDSGAPVFVPIDTVIDGRPVHGALLVGLFVAGGKQTPSGPDDMVVFHTVKQVECFLRVQVLTSQEADSGSTPRPTPRPDCG